MIPVMGALLFAACKSDMEMVQEVGEHNDRPFQVVLDAEYFFTDSAKLRNILRAGRLEQFANDSQYVQVSDGLQLEIFDRAEQHSATLTSDEGYYFESKSKMEAHGNVVFASADEDSLFTELLIWQSDSGIVRSPVEVRIVRGDGLELEGKGLWAKDDFSRYTILKPKGDISLPDEPR